MNAKKSNVNSTVPETKTAAAETAKPAAKATKSAAEKKTTVNAAKPAAEKKVSAEKTAPVKTAEKKSAKSAAEKKTAAEKRTAAAKKPATKAAAKKTTEKAAEKKPTAKRASAIVNVETVCAKLEKKISKTKAAAVKEKIAVDIEVYGFTEGASSQKMYVELNDGKVTVSPHTYDAKDFRVAISLDNAVAFVNGKITLKALLDSEGFYADGNIAKAIKLASIF